MLCSLLLLLLLLLPAGFGASPATCGRRRVTPNRYPGGDGNVEYPVVQEGV